MSEEDKPVAAEEWFDTQQVIAFSILYGFIAILAVWTIFPQKLDPTAEKIVLFLLGSLTAKFSTAVDYFLGSGAGANRKTPPA